MISLNQVLFSIPLLIFFCDREVEQIGRDIKNAKDKGVLNKFLNSTDQSSSIASYGQIFTNIRVTMVASALSTPPFSLVAEIATVPCCYANPKGC